MIENPKPKVGFRDPKRCKPEAPNYETWQPEISRPMPPNLTESLQLHSQSNYLSIYLSLSLYLYVYIENTDFPILFLRVPVITMLWYSPNPFQTLLLVDQAPTLAVRVPQLVWRSS